MTRYTSATDADRREMLAEIGASASEKLFAGVPADVRLDRGVELAEGMSANSSSIEAAPMRSSIAFRSASVAEV